MPEPGFALSLMAGERGPVNGAVVRCVVLDIDGQQKDAKRVTLDSQHSISVAAGSWAKQFGLDKDAVVAELGRLNMSVLADNAERRQRFEASKDKRDRVSDVADTFLRSLKPVWHRKRKAIYLETVEAEITVASLWTLATDKNIDTVGETEEAAGPGGENGMPYRQLLLLFKDAVLMAAARVMRGLPEHSKTDIDATIDHGELLSWMVNWLLKGRSFRLDCGTLTTVTLYSWACDLEPGGGWRQCFTTPVFARIDKDGSQPRIAVKGEFLAAELRYESKRRLAKDLTAAGLAVTDNPIRCATKVWRTWEITVEVLQEIATNE